MSKKGRPVGKKNKKWTPQEKERIVLRYYHEDISRKKLCEEESVHDSMLHGWIKKYEEGGIDALVSKTGKSGKSGNAYAALHLSKDLPEIKRLPLEVARLHIEVERLKKGYMVKGGGLSKAFVIINDSNSR